MRLTTRLTRKRAALLVRFLDRAMKATSDPHDPKRLAGMDEDDSRQVRYILDTIYDDCAVTQGSGAMENYDNRQRLHGSRNGEASSSHAGQVQARPLVASTQHPNAMGR